MTDTLYLNWISAVALLKGPVVPADIARVIGQTTLRWGSRTEVALNIASITMKPAEGFTGKPRRCIVLVNQRLEPLPYIERIEMLMRVAIRCHQYYKGLSDLMIEPVYDALGVWQSPLFDPFTRWTRLGMKYHEGKVAASIYEDRPRCPLCKIPVSTGHRSPKIHDGCLEYYKNVYAPALKAQMEATRVG